MVLQQIATNLVRVEVGKCGFDPHKHCKILGLTTNWVRNRGTISSCKKKSYTKTGYIDSLILTCFGPPLLRGIVVSWIPVCGSTRARTKNTANSV